MSTIEQKIVDLCLDLVEEGLTPTQAIRQAGQIEIFAKAMDNNLFSDKAIAIYQTLEALV